MYAHDIGVLSLRRGMDLLRRRENGAWHNGVSSGDAELFGGL